MIESGEITAPPGYQAKHYTPTIESLRVSPEVRAALTPVIVETPSSPPDLRRLKLQEEIRIRQTQKELIEGLPHLYGWKFYPWARKFFESRNRVNLLCAANQISKSSTQIRKCIHWATDKALWPELWQRTPTQFWYLYPDQETVNIEFALKWEREFLPRGKYKDDPVHGWEKLTEGKDKVKGIRFNSGVFVFFKTYTKQAQTLQAGSCDAVFADEELPEKIAAELMVRLNGTDGYFHMVFTATLGQELWRRAMEPEKGEDEAFPGAHKQTVSLYECARYEDGSPSPWTPEKIGRAEGRCPTDREKQKRIFGRFVITEGLVYPSFSATLNVKKGHPLPKDWLVFSGTDKGTGGESNHPAAHLFLGVSPDFKQGRVFAAWRGDGIPTTDGDILIQYQRLKKDLRVRPIAQKYDTSAKSFGILANRAGEPFTSAERGHAIGEDLINSLFRHVMLIIYETPETMKLVRELATLKQGVDKSHAKDDLIDCLRYAVAEVPWDFSDIVLDPPEKPVEEHLNHGQQELKERRERFEEPKEDEADGVHEEFAEWNELYGT